LQKLWEYRNKLAYKAVCAVFAYYCSQINSDAKIEEDSQELATFAESLLNNPQHGFIFKGMENARKVS